MKDSERKILGMLSVALIASVGMPSVQAQPAFLHQQTNKFQLNPLAGDEGFGVTRGLGMHQRQRCRLVCHRGV